MVSCINIIRLHNFCASSAGFPAPPPSSINDTPAHQTTEKPSQQLGFAYTTPCLVTGWWRWTWNFLDNFLNLSEKKCFYEEVSFFRYTMIFQFPVSLVTCTTVTLENVNNVLMDPINLSGARPHVGHVQVTKKGLIFLCKRCVFSKHNHWSTRSIKSGHVQESFLSILRQRRSWNHGEPKLSKTVPGE